jgi:TusA-related sulfurtransferase
MGRRPRRRFSSTSRRPERAEQTIAIYHNSAESGIILSKGTELLMKNSKEIEMESPKNKKEINLRGEVCPYTFVKSKLIIEELEPGELLEVVVDFAPATTNIPRSMTNEGHEVLDVSQLSPKEWKIVIRKGHENGAS